jgi:uncharacterized protein YecE (DUF72 family)
VIRTGIGGWTFAPWRGAFYPEGTRQADELAYASRRLGSIEINGTFYRTQSPASFAKWASETPEGFVFSLKGGRVVTNRRDLSEAGPSIERFVSSGITELGGKLGPILWQFAAHKKFSADELARFLALLPANVEGRPLRHAVEATHPSFRDPKAIEIFRDAGVAFAIVHSGDGPEPQADVTADFVYARLKGGEDAEPTCYPDAELDRWAARFTRLAAGETPEGLPLLGEPDGRIPPKDCFVYLISGGKVRAPAGAEALARKLAASGAGVPQRL